MESNASALDSKVKFMKFLIIILSLLLINLQYHLWFAQGSYQENHALRQMVEQKRKENAALKTRNDALAAEVADLKQGLSAIEEHARMELGMIKRNEVFYQIVE